MFRGTAQVCRACKAICKISVKEVEKTNATVDKGDRLGTI